MRKEVARHFVLYGCRCRRRVDGLLCGGRILTANVFSRDEPTRSKARVWLVQLAVGRAAAARPAAYRPLAATHTVAELSASEHGWRGRRSRGRKAGGAGEP
ncbi:hypothetical protein NDU88_001831 [Pleurodeles waltl]|uniref:Uncharacterized protein n=1 Tax=Pleurodeles waltl TaxID=8319 RepID=A0AAV7KRX9_PLEWA|nr:hypothetical protein NDU88_001831 [Pleurodeles waltl]